jgi:hypothetical protein
MRARSALAIALVSAAVMLYEVAITRILSVVLWYHFAFLAVSLAMLGLGAPGVWYSLRPASERSLERALLAAGLLVPLSIVLLFRLGNHVPDRPAFATVCILAPMLALGSAVCILLLRARGSEIARIYGADLLGAMLGALAVVPLMNVVPTPALVAGAGFLPLAALVALGGPRRGVGSAIAVVLAAGLWWGEPFRLRYAKYYEEPESRLVEKWTPTARLTVFPRPFFLPDPASAFGWGMGSRYMPRPVEQLWLEQDGSAGTPITRFDGSLAALDHLLWDVTSVGDQVAAPARVCVVGVGGGRDVLAALASGAREVDAVELNGHIVDLVSRRFGAFSGDVYHLPGVRARVSEGRAFLTTTPARYDLVQISFIDSWAATAAGAYALAENYLYTVEAYRLYWNRLRPGGIVSTSRWLLGDRQLETVRLAFLVDEALRLEGVAEPRAHLAIVQGGGVATVLMSREPFTGPRGDALARVCRQRGFQQLWPVPPGGDARLAALLQRGPRGLGGLGIDLTPPRDDRPFFFQTLGLFSRTDPALVARLSANEQAVVLLRQVLAIVCVLALVLFFLPFALGRRLPRAPGFWAGSAYFAAIGAAFMLVEVPTIQKAILYLGHPSHATTIVLASLLFGAGLGSLGSGRVPPAALRRGGFVLVLATSAAGLGLEPLFRSTLGWPFALRALVTAALVGTVGFLMGFAFPAGMLRFSEANRAWFWAVNGATSVVASVVSLAFSMRFGFTRVALAGAAAYLVAWALLPARPSPPLEATSPAD